MVKRGSERQITKNDCDEEEAPVQAGVFGKASAATMNRRRIVRVKRQPATNNTLGPNPFAGVALTATTPPKESTQPPEEAVQPPEETVQPPAQTPAHTPTQTQAQTLAQPPADANTATPPKETAQGQKETGDNATTTEAQQAPARTGAVTSSTTGGETNVGTGFAAFAHSASPFKQLVSGTAAFGGSGGFGSVATNGHQQSTVFGGDMSWPTPGQKSVFSGETKQVTPAPASSPKVTGEEEEETLFNHEATLYAMVGSQWKHRGKGDLRVNSSKESGGRLIMRQKVTLRLFLNAGIFKGIKVSRMGQNAVTFSCVNGANEGLPTKEGDEGDSKTTTGDKGNLKVYALRFLAKGEGGEMLVKQFEKAVEQCTEKVSEKNAD